MVRRVAVLLLGQMGLLALRPANAAAQQVTLSVTGASTLMQNATLGNYSAGFIIDATPVEYTVALVGGGARDEFCATVSLTGTTNSSAANGVNDVLWGTNANTQSTALSTTAATVASHFLTTSSRTATGTIYFRTSLAWADGPGTYLGPSLTFSVTGRRVGNQNQCT